eukprot:gb/GEZN01000972.1/.p1 GENE.gb/GEZN01000972.1/~~gb/GEZN01000972.1/.p1  ORF type:complete len:946 (-),score=243.68 gb/GEZN01000972.1/:459-3296(-)
MSRFFSRGDSDSEESESEDEQVQAGGGANIRGQAAKAPTSFMIESSDEEEEKRTIRSEKDRRFDEMRKEVANLSNSLKINDWVKVSETFDNMDKLLKKATNVIRTAGVPNFFMKSIVSLDDTVQDTFKNKTLIKKMNKPNAQAFNKMRQKIAKFMKSQEKAVELYKANPQDESDEEPAAESKKKKKPAVKKKQEEVEESDEESDDDDSGRGMFRKPPKTKAEKADKGDKGEKDSGSEEDDLSSDSDESDIDISNKTITRDFWVKTEKDYARERRDKERELRAVAEKKAKAAKRLEKGAGITSGPTKEEAAEERRKQQDREQQDKQKPVEFTPQAIVRKLNTILEARGRPKTDRAQMIKDLQLLDSKATVPNTLVKIKVTLVSCMFETALNRGTTYMKIPLWKECLAQLDALVTYLLSTPVVRLSEDEDVEETLEEEEGNEGIDKQIGAVVSGDTATEHRGIKKKKKEVKQEQKEVKKTDDGKEILYVQGNLYAFVSKLYQEFTSSLQQIDHHAPEYLQRLVDERSLIKLVLRMRTYYDFIKKQDFQPKVAHLALELTYYHYHKQHDALTHAGQQYLANAPRSRVEDLASFIYEHGDGMQRTRALLMHVYYYALHHRFQEARDLVLMSHVQDRIHDSDIKTRIVFNRMMAQMGLCAFKCGKYNDALNMLSEFYPSAKIKELLAQGVLRNWGSDRNFDKENLERRRQYPFHMHINADLIEAFHLMSGMFKEIPVMARFGFSRRRLVSKTFRHKFGQYNKQAFQGPPENNSDGIMAAGVALQRGDWRAAWQYLDLLPMWRVVPNQATVKRDLLVKVKQVALETFLLTYGPQLSSISFSRLEEFGLPRKDIFKLVSKMIFEDQLQGAWDQSTESLVMHAEEPTPLQAEALNYVEKVQVFVEQNERMMEQYTGLYREGHHYNQGNRWNESKKRNQGTRGGRGRSRLNDRW